MRVATTKTRKRKSSKTVALRTNGKHKIDSASTIRAPIGMDRILRPQARFNWLMPNVASITPQYIEMLLNGALAGNHVQRWELFDLMLRTWPELSACCQELTYGVVRKKLIYEPFHEEDEKPTPSALERMKVCSAALRRMSPEPISDGADLKGTIRDILDAWFRGCSVSEIIWETVDDKAAGTIMTPSCTYWVYPVCYAFTSDNVIGMMPPTISKGGTWPFSSTTNVPTNQAQVIPFPDNKFLISVHKTKSGSPLSGPLLVPLCWWWCAANFSSDWLLNLAQVFGLPFRWTTYAAGAPQETINAICNMLQNMGSNAWAAFPEGTTMELIDSNKSGSDHSPQGELLDRADRYARNLILGQTMTGSHGTTGKGGGQAFGEVEADVKSDRIDAAGSFVAEIINNQLIKFVLQLNYGDTEEMPRVKFLEDDVAGLPQAQTYKTLADAGTEIGVDHIRKVFDIPEPAEGEETIGGPKPQPDFGQFGGSFGQDQTGAQPDNTGEPPKDSADIAASDQTGHPFRGNQYVTIAVGDKVNTPLGEGSVEKFGPRYTWVNFGKGHVRKFESGLVQKVQHHEFTFSTGNLPEVGSRVKFQRYIRGSTDYGKTHVTGTVTERDDHGFSVKHDDGHVERIGRSQILGVGRYYRPKSTEGEVSVSHVPQTPKRPGDEAATIIPRSRAEKLPSRSAPFPSITHSDEEKRRLMRNAGLQTKLLELNEIEDDAVFARELEALADKYGTIFMDENQTERICKVKRLTPRHKEICQPEPK